MSSAPGFGSKPPSDWRTAGSGKLTRGTFSFDRVSSPVGPNGVNENGEGDDILMGEDEVTSDGSLELRASAPENAP